MAQRRLSRTHRTIWAAASLLAGLSATALPIATQAAEPANGGTLRVGFPAFTICYDHSQTPFLPFVHQAIVDNLLEQDIKTGQIVPWLATDYKIEEGGKRFVLTLRSDVTFSNGEPLDAEAVKLNFDNHIAQGALGKSPQASAYLAGYVGTDVIDAHTVAVNFDAPKASFIQALTEKPLGIIAPETIKTKTPEERCAEGVIGSGPFIIDKIVEGQEIDLKARADYAWASPNRAHPGRAYVDNVVFKLLPESGVRVGSLLSNQVDVIYTVPALDIDRVERAGDSILAAPFAGSVYTLFFNYTKPITADPAVRQAFQAAINRQEVVEVAYTKFDHPATSVLSTRVPQYTDFSADLSYDPEKARDILEKGGWTLGSDGIREKDGTKLVIQFRYVDEADKTPLELIQQQLRQVGIDFEIAQITRPELTLWEAPNTNWDVISAQLVRPDADILLSRYHPKYSWWLSGQNLDPYPEVTHLLEQQAVEIVPEKRQALVTEIQQKLIENAYAVPLREVTSVWGVTKGTHGLWLNIAGYPNWADTWLDQ